MRERGLKHTRDRKICGPTQFTVEISEENEPFER
jgi:hypothetical protein